MSKLRKNESEVLFSLFEEIKDVLRTKHDLMIYKRRVNRLETILKIILMREEEKKFCWDRDDWSIAEQIGDFLVIDTDMGCWLDEDDLKGGSNDE